MAGFEDYVGVYADFFAYSGGRGLELKRGEEEMGKEVRVPMFDDSVGRVYNCAV